MWSGSGECWEFCFQSVLGHNRPVCLHSILCQTGYAIAKSTSALKQLQFCTPHTKEVHDHLCCAVMDEGQKLVLYAILTLTLAQD